MQQDERTNPHSPSSCLVQVVNYLQLWERARRLIRIRGHATGMSKPKWLIDHISENGVNSRKIIIYCRSIDMVSDLFLCLKDSLGLHAYPNQEKRASNPQVEMFHKNTSQDSKERIINEFICEDLGFLPRVWDIPSCHEWSVAERVKRRWIALTIFNKDECKYLFIPFQLKNKACRFHSFICMSMSCLLHKILQRHVQCSNYTLNLKPH